MAFKLIVLFAALAVANAGYLNAPVAHYSPATAVSTSYISQPLAAVHAAPVAAVHAAPLAYNAAPLAYNAYQQAPVAIHAPAVGATHQSVLRSLGGNQAVSHYSKAVDSAFSTVRKYDTRITNDAVSVAHTPVVAHAAPYVAHAASYAAPVVAHAAPYVSHAAPVAYAAQAPVIAKAAIGYSPAAVVSHTTFEGLGTHYAW